MTSGCPRAAELHQHCQQLQQLCLSTPAAAQCSCWRLQCCQLLHSIRLLIPGAVHLQDTVWNTPEYYSPILECYEWVFGSETQDAVCKDLSSLKLCGSASISSEGLSDSSTDTAGQSEPEVSELNAEQSDGELSEEAGAEQSCEECSSGQCPAEELCNAWVMCLANLVAGNSGARTALYRSLTLHKIRHVLLSAPAAVAQKWCAVLHNCMLEQHLRDDVIRATDCVLVSRLCCLYCMDGPAACFALYCLELLLCAHTDHHSLLQYWPHLSPCHRVLCLTAAGRLLGGQGGHRAPVVPPGPPLVKMVAQLYKNEAGKILSNDERQLADCDPQVVRELCSTLLSAASSDPHRTVLQDGGEEEAGALLFITLCFLKALNSATFSKKSQKSGTDAPSSSSSSASAAETWSALHFSPAKDDTAADVGVGLRCDLVQIIGNLAHGCRANQDKLREYGGLEEVFFSCRRDASNPLIQEAVIFTLGCCLRDNLDNITHLRSAINTGKSDRDCPVMNRLGLVPDQFVQMPPAQQ